MLKKIKKNTETAVHLSNAVIGPLVLVMWAFNIQNVIVGYAFVE